jgi:hypothetical protein
MTSGTTLLTVAVNAQKKEPRDVRIPDGRFVIQLPARHHHPSRG